MDQQWIVKSLTIWGVIIAALTAILPAVVGLFPDLSATLTPEWLASLDANVKSAITGVGVLVSTVLVLIDRLKGSGEVQKSLTWRKPKEDWED